MVRGLVLSGNENSEKKLVGAALASKKKQPREVVTQRAPEKKWPKKEMAEIGFQ